jgi:membrane associated rhomboid family serine protease
VILTLSQIILWTNLQDGNLYGVNNQSTWQNLFLFSPAHGLTDFFISMILSILFHSSLYHFSINIVSFLVIGSLFEQLQSRLKTTLIFISCHLLTVITIYANYIYKEVDKNLIYSGASAGVLGLVTAYLFLKNKKITYMGIVLILFYSSYQNNPILIDPHLIAAIFGLIMGTLLKKLPNKKS